MNNSIRFIDDTYKELFRIPDGGKVTITAADGYTHQAVCKYIDDYHFYLDDACLHICQFAEMLKRNRSKCEPVIEHTYEFVPVTADELSFAMKNADKEMRGCVGTQKGSFNRDDKLFWDTFVTETEALKSDDFYTEFAEAMNFLRLNGDTPLLRDRHSMLCGSHGVLKEPNDIFDISIFKLTGESHTHYIKCFTPKDSRSDKGYFFTVYSYNTLELMRYRDLKYVEQNQDCLSADKFYKTDSGFTELYYNPDADAGGQIVQIDFDEYTVKAAAQQCKNPKDFFGYIESAGKGYLTDVGTAGFRAAFDDFKNIKSDYEGTDKKTMHELMKDAGIKIPNKNVER